MSPKRMGGGRKKSAGDPAPSADEINMPHWYCTVAFGVGIILYILYPINFHGVNGEILEQQEC